MDMKDFNYVVAIAKYQNITRAAESLYVTQPTLTKFLKSLESSLGQKLFKKLGNRFVLTYAGERYVARAIEILNIKRELDSEMADIIKNNAGSLKIAFPVMRGTYMLPCTLPIFHQMYPNVRLKVIEADSSMLESMVLSGETDLAFFNLPIKSAEVDYDVISHEEILLVLSADHPLAHAGVEREGCGYPWLELAGLSDTQFILQTKGQRTRQIVDQLLKNEHFDPIVKIETSNISATVELASKGYAACFVSQSHLNHIHLDKKLALFSVGSPCTMVDFVVAYRRGSYLPYHAREYIKIVKDFTYCPISEATY